MIPSNKIVLSGVSNNISEYAKGKLQIIGKLEDTKKIKKGDIVYIKNKSFKSDSLFVVYSSIKHGVGGVILEKGGKIDHGIVAAKELHIPMITTSTSLDHLLFPGQNYTLIKENLYKGSYPLKRIKYRKSKNLETNHKVKLNLGFSLTLRLYPEIVKIADGVAFCRLEFSLLEILEGVHPNIFLRKNSSEILSKRLMQTIEPIVSAFGDKPVWFRTDDFSAEQLLEMEGGKRNELKELNSMMGWRGIRRSIQDHSLLIPQFKALKSLLDKGYKNIGIFPPMTIDISEYRAWLKIAFACGLDKGIKFGLMVETPAAALTIKKFIPYISFVIFGTNDLTQFTLALDRTNPRISHLFNENNPAVLSLLKYAIKECKKHNIETSIGGQAGSDIPFVSKMLNFGISGTSVNPDLETIDKIRKHIYAYEQDKQAI